MRHPVEGFKAPLDSGAGAGISTWDSVLVTNGTYFWYFTFYTNKNLLFSVGKNKSMQFSCLFIQKYFRIKALC